MGGLVLLEPEVAPSFPGWVESGARNDISGVFNGLRATLGRGTPALPQAAVTPYSIPDGDLGIPAYGDTKAVNDAIKTAYDAATRAMAATVGKSATLTVLARNAVAQLLALQSQPGGLQVYPSWFVGPIPAGAIRPPTPGGPRVAPGAAAPETPYDWSSAAVTAATGGGEAGATRSSSTPPQAGMASPWAGRTPRAWRPRGNSSPGRTS